MARADHCRAALDPEFPRAPDLSRRGAPVRACPKCGHRPDPPGPTVGDRVTVRGWPGEWRVVATSWDWGPLGAPSRTVAVTRPGEPEREFAARDCTVLPPA